jgi:hypothetical protein
MKKKALALAACAVCAFWMAAWVDGRDAHAGGVTTVTANPGDDLQAVFDTLPPSICAAKWDGQREGWFEMGAQPLAQRFRTPDSAMTATTGFLMMKRAGAPGGQIWLQVETNPGNNARGGPVSPDCISTRISAVQPAQDESSNVVFAFPNGCALSPDTEYWLVLEKDGAYDGGYSAGAASVSWRTNGQEYVPCESWNNSRTAVTTGDCDKAVYDGSAGWTVTPSRDMVFGLGSPSVVRLNPGLYSSQAVTSAYRAFTSVLGAGRASTIWTAGQDGPDQWAFFNYFTCFMELADIGFEGGGTGDPVTPLIIFGASGDSIHDLSVNGSGTGLVITSSVDTTVRDNVLVGGCKGLMIATTADDRGFFNNNVIQASGTSANCEYGQVIGLMVMPGVTGHVGAQNHFSDNTIEVNVFVDVVSYGILLDGQMDGTRVEGGRIEVNYLGSTANQSVVGIYDATGESSRFKDVGLNVSCSNAGEGATTVGVVTAWDSSLEFYGGEMKVAAGGGTVVDTAKTGTGDKLTVRNTNLYPITYGNLGGTSTVDVSPAFGLSPADNDGLTDVTVYGCTAGHIVYCWTDVVTCEVLATDLSAVHTVTVWEGGTDCGTGSPTIYCACVKSP